MNIALLGYTGEIVSGHPVANTTAEMLSKFDFTKAWEELMKQKGVTTSKFDIDLKMAFVFQFELAFRAIIYAHGKLPGTIDEATAANAQP